MWHRTFPVYESHEDVRCFNCYSELKTSDHKLSGFYEGRWAKRCANCSLWTYYDLKEGEVAAMQTRDTQMSIIRQTRERLRSDLAAHIPLDPDRDWRYENLREESEEYEGPLGDGLVIFQG